jgi:hypothetical protein
MIVDALLGLAETPLSDEATRTVAATVSRPSNLNDRWIRDAAVAAGARDDNTFLQLMLAGQLPGNASDEYIENISAVVTRVSRHYAAGVPSGDVDGLVDFIGSVADYDATLAVAYVSGLAEGWPYDAVPSLTDAQEIVVREARSELPESFHEGLELLAEKWGIEGVAD